VKQKDSVLRDIERQLLLKLIIIIIIIVIIKQNNKWKSQYNKSSNLTEIKPVTYAAAKNIRDVIKGTGSYKLETQSQKHPRKLNE
jgi:hypothetical protein